LNGIILAHRYNPQFKDRGCDKELTGQGFGMVIGDNIAMVERRLEWKNQRLVEKNCWRKIVPPRIKSPRITLFLSLTLSLSLSSLLFIL